MKKTVFLFLLIFTFVLKINSEVLGTEVVYVIDNHEIIITRIIEDGVTGFTIEKTGVNPFVSTIISDTEHYYIVGVKQIEDYYIVYGYGFVYHSGTEYDALFFVIDFAGNTVHKEFRDYGAMESVNDVFYVDNVLITHVEKLNNGYSSYEFVSNFFTSYDLNFNYIDSIEVSPLIKKLNSNDMYVLVGYQNSEYDIAIRSDLSLLNKDELVSISEGEIFVESVSIEFINGATLNNDYIENGVTITYPGEYTLNYNNRIYNFTLDPLISGVVNNQIYSNSVTISVSGGNAILNNDIYISNTEIINPGNYEFIVTGANNYSEELSFTITSDLSGIINNSSYLEPVTIDFNGDGYLNNQFIESPYEVSVAGDYILKIRGENNYMETYFFSFEEDVKETSFIDFVQRVDILILVVVLISGGIILKKK